MKKIKKITALFALIALPLLGMAQRGEDGNRPPKDFKEREEKIDKLKIGYFTSQLNLTSEEAEKFWPVYNELEGKLKEMRKSMRKTIEEIESGFDKMSNEDAKKKMTQIFEFDEKELALKKEYSDKFSKILGEKRALQLMGLEHEFRRELMDALREPGPPSPPNDRDRPTKRN